MGLHIVIWRACRPKRHALVLTGIFILVPAVVLMMAGFLKPDVSWPELYAVFLLHASLSFAYIQVYPASQADSPSFKILLHVNQSMPQGLTAEEIGSLFPASVLLEDRIQDLIESHLVAEEAGKLSLTKQGKLLIQPFIALRKAIGLPAGAG